MHQFEIILIFIDTIHATLLGKKFFIFKYALILFIFIVLLKYSDYVIFIDILMNFLQTQPNSLKVHIRF